MDKQESHSDWDGVAALMAAIWLILVSTQAVLHLFRYQFTTPSDWPWRLDFTPVYLPLLALTVLVIVLRQWKGRSRNKPI